LIVPGSVPSEAITLSPPGRALKMSFAGEM
jgi:hypothetical protein